MRNFLKLSKDQKIFKIALDVPVNKFFDYISNEASIKIGQYVKVPFGKRNLIGICCKTSIESEIPSDKLKRIISTENEIVFDESMLKLLYFVSDYYHHPIGQTIMSVVPSRIKKNSLTLKKKELIFKADKCLTSEVIDNFPSRQLRLKKVAQAILEKDLRQKDLSKLVSNGSECVGKLEKMGLISSEVFIQEISRSQKDQPILNKEQQKVDPWGYSKR